MNLLLLLMFLSCGSLSALIPQRAIVSSDDNPLYIQFWPMVAKAWKERIGIKPTLAFISDEDVTLDESCGEVVRFKPLPGIPTSFYTQVIRLLLPVLYKDEVCIVSDMDMLPISKVYFLDLVSSVSADCFVVWNDRAYDKKRRQYPMCYNAAKGSIFCEIFGISKVEEIPDKVREWYAWKIGRITDEVVLYGLLMNWVHYPYKVKLLGYETGNQRIDRSRWHFDPLLLKAGYYIDSHMLRPYSEHRDKIDRLLSALGL